MSLDEPALGLDSILASMKPLVTPRGSANDTASLYPQSRQTEAPGREHASADIFLYLRDAGSRSSHLEYGSILVLSEVLLACVLPVNPEHGLSCVIPAHP